MSRMRRMLFVSGILLVCAWTLVPIYLVALGGIGGAATVYAWPKPFWPAGLSFGNFAAFLQIEGLWPAMLRSVEVAVLCMALSLLLGAPAGYALARFAFRGANVYRLMILMTRAFPVGILALPLAVGFVRLGIYDTPFGCRADAHGAGAAVRRAGHLQPVPRHSSRTGGSGLGVRMLRARGRSGASCCRWQFPASPRRRSSHS